MNAASGQKNEVRRAMKKRFWRSDNRLYKPALQRKTLVIQSGCHGSFLGLLDLEVEGGHKKSLDIFMVITLVVYEFITFLKGENDE